MSEKRKREENWRNEEKLLLVECVKKRKSIIDNKSYDTTIIREKKKAWREIEEEMKINGFQRGALRIREMWRRIRIQARTEIGNYLKELKKAGDSVQVVEPPEILWMVRELCSEDFLEMEDSSIDNHSLPSTSKEIETDPLECNTNTEPE